MIRKLVLLVGIVVIVGGIYAWKKGAIQTGEDGIKIDTNKIKEEVKKDLDNPYIKGSALYTKGSYEDAIAEFRRGLKEDPGNDSAPTARYRIAECYKKLNQPKKAMDAYQTFLKKHPEHTLAPSAAKQIEILRATSG